MSATKIPIPQMRGLMQTYIKQRLIVLGIASATFCGSWWWFVCEARKKRYAEFYKTYDAEAAFERLRKRGVFLNVDPN